LGFLKIMSYSYNNNPPPAYTREERSVAKQVKIQIPAGVRPGNTITVNLPTGKSVKVTVPKGMRAGNTLTVNYNQMVREEVGAAAVAPESRNYDNRDRDRGSTAFVPAYVPVPLSHPSSHAPQIPQVMAVPIGVTGAQWSDNNKGRSRSVGNVGRDTYRHGMQDDTSRDEELAWKLANDDWAPDRRLQQQMQERERADNQRRQEQERRDHEYAANLAGEQKQQYAEPPRRQTESDAEMARRLARQWDTYDGRRK